MEFTYYCLNCNFSGKTVVFPGQEDPPNCPNCKHKTYWRKEDVEERIEIRSVRSKHSENRRIDNSSSNPPQEQEDVHDC